MRQIEQASPYTLEAISRQQIIDSKVIASATLSRYVRLLLEFSSSVEPTQAASKNHLDDLLNAVNSAVNSATPKANNSELSSNLGFESGCTIYSPFQVFALCWVKDCSQRRGEKAPVIRVRLKNKEPQYLFTNNVEHPAHKDLKRILTFVESQEQAATPKTELG